MMGMNGAAASPAPDGMALCLACGFCCEGTLHSYTVLQPDEVDRAGRWGLPVELIRGKPGFRQPCPLYRMNRCSVYDARPCVCSRYECALFVRHGAGELTLAQALGIVQAAKDLLVPLQHALPDHRSFRALLTALLQAADAESDGADAVDDRLDDATVLTNIASLAFYLHRHFDPPPA